MNAILLGLRSAFLLLSLAAAAVAQTPTYYFGTFAGASSRGTADGAGSNTRFSNPAGLAFDSAGNLYVADTANHTIRKITADGAVSTLAGAPVESGTLDGIGSSARFKLPQALALHTDGNLYVGEAGGVRRVTRDGVVTRVIGPNVFSNPVVALVSEPGGTLIAADQFIMLRLTDTGETPILFHHYDFMPNGSFGALARDAGGSLFVAINGVIPQTSPAGSFISQARIYRVSPGGAISTFADETNGLSGVGHLTALAVDTQGSVYAAGSSGAVYRFSAGNMTVYAGMPGSVGARDGAALQALFTQIYGLAFDSAGNLHAAELNNTIRRITSAGVVTTVAGIPWEDSDRHLDAKGTAARFSSPGGVAVTTNGIVYIADTHNHVVRRIATDGTVTTLAGSPGQAGYANGTGAEARFNSPFDLAIDPAGNLYAIERSGAVRKITPTGEVSTLAGGAANGSPPASDGQGSEAKFGVLSAIAVSATGDIYVAESQNYSNTQGQIWARVRKITPAGAVTTIQVPTVYPHSYFSGMAFDRNGVLYLADPVYLQLHRMPPQGNADKVRLDDFFAPRRIAADAHGSLYLTEDNRSGASRVARYSATGEFTIIGGARYEFGHHDAVGTRARFTSLNGIAVDAGGALILADDDNTVRKAVLASSPTISAPPANQTVVAGAAATLTVSATALPEPTYQWYFNGSAIAGATTSSCTIASASSTNAGNYHVVVTNELGSVTSATATLTVSAPPSGGSSSGASGGGGGGAPSDFFFAACAALAFARMWQRRGGARE